MKICGIICEYNPFHNGHLYQIQETKKQGATHIVCVMSGNFVQRGDVACFCKQTRAKVALLNGADLVIEMPTPMAMSPARNFSFNAVNILKNIGADMISFGTECANIQTLKEIANNILVVEKSKRFKQLLHQGKSHISVRQELISDMFSKEQTRILSTPNNLLAIEYIIAMNKLDFDMDIYTLLRKGANHDSRQASKNIACASHIREMIYKYGVDSIKNFVPESAFNIYKQEIDNNNAPCKIDKLNNILLYKLLTCTKQQLKDIFDISEGIENRIIKAVNECETIEEITNFVCTKRYTKSRIRRILLNILLDIDKDLAKSDIPYCRILALNDKGREILKYAKDKTSMMISPKFSNIYKQNFKLAYFEEKATNIYNLTAPKRQNMLNEFNLQVFIQKP